ncbi:prolyl aminopeptidase [Abyssibacter profundi]|uniref:Proline iminopeptidase n=1 Tax=Abyssibacter profundi TaxID=2182787 RepID=A0A383XPS5_9GAMM|nr:prolyl aminopeptidase [Abyssibacter profundi]MBV62147.1 prolyl aminopeptidase [Nevskiales bacterium]PWN54629.1 prolyl aminopeptidase [Abyssibacter profundi]
MKTLYPELPARVTGTLPPEDGHTVWFEESGNPDGIPVVFVHGGPGGGTQPLYRRFFDPDRYRIVLFDQRGCGRSTPHAELEHNNTWALVSDMERLREHLDIKAWVVFGGSWGSTLSLAYSQNHPDRCLAIILRGIFLLRQQELEWFYQDGASRMFPDAWQRYYHAIPEAERDDLLQAYYRRLTHDDPEVRIPAARAWATWEASTSKLIPSDSLVQSFEDAKFAEAFARIEAHYFVHGGFLDHPDQLIHNVERIRHIPGFIVQGRYDVVCPPQTAWDLHRAWPEAEFHMVPDAGHSATEPGIVDRLVDATDRTADRLFGG